MAPRAIAAALFAAAIATMAGCAFTYTIPPERLPQTQGDALVEQWPIAVGLWYAPEAMQAAAAKDAWRVPLGEPVRATFDWALGRMFASVRTLDGLPTGSTQSSLPGVVAVRSVAADPYPASVTVSLALVASDGSTLASWQVTGHGEYASGYISAAEVFATVAADFALAIRDAAAVFMTTFVAQPGARAWLEANGAAAPPGRPVFAGEFRPPPPSPKVVLLTDASRWRYGRSALAMSCLGDRLAAMSPPVAILTAEDLRAALFPWLERSTAPRGTAALLAFIAQPAVQRRLAALGIGYLVDFSGGTVTDVDKGGILCGAGYGGGGCLGFAWGSRESSFRATVLDVRAAIEVAAEAVRETGGVYVPAFVLPIPLIAATETAACDALASRVHRVVAGTRAPPR